ncbi:tRNA (adenine(37)-N6)-methyltransferase-like [Penaeus japonicus]|uniref:tRNA (adenine(37)-N6)-methyltransferase-like n=1 Tax=Penaeus japonicus TaxID=27405 RepID=UPI001C71776D|nr:tRNA (adenine(37)-N6)-methyltransferase-like [Penaeus japonicus]
MSYCNCTTSESVELRNQIRQARNELNNLRKMIQGLRAQFRKDKSRLEEIIKLKLPATWPLLSDEEEVANSKNQKDGSGQERLFQHWKPIGHIKSWFHHKNGTPRQGSVTTLSRGIIRIDKKVFNNPQHSLEGLQEYSHIWIFFIFNKNIENRDGKHTKTKVAPPRLNGKRIGIFATRSPHRPNPLGLTLARLEYIEGDCIYLSGLDILDGTPVVDIKPYIPQYDYPQNEIQCSNQSLSDKEGKESAKYSSEDNVESIRKSDMYSDECFKSNIDAHGLSIASLEGRLPNSEKNSRIKEKCYQQITTAEWLQDVHSSSLQVIFNPIAADQIKRFSTVAEDELYR